MIHSGNWFFFVKFCKDFPHANLVWLTPQGPILEKLLDVSKTSDLSIFYCSYTSFLVDMMHLHTHMGQFLKNHYSVIHKKWCCHTMPFWIPEKLNSQSSKSTTVSYLVMPPHYVFFNNFIGYRLPSALKLGPIS